MSSLSDTARLASSPHDIMLQDPDPDPHPDLLTPPTGRSEGDGKEVKMTGGGMRAAMNARYDPSTKLATGTTMGEYRRINMRSTTVGMWGGLVGGGLITMALKRRTSLSKNALTFSFLFTASSLSYVISQSLVQTRLQEVVAKANDAKLPRAPDGGGYMLNDGAHTDRTSDMVVRRTEDEVLKDELRTLGMGKDRTRWGKGRGLSGEVEEEGEMRDTFFRPGVPRREV